MPAHYNCCVVDCRSDSRKLANLAKYPEMAGVTFHSLPSAKTDNLRRQEWLRMIKRDNFVPNKYTRVCCKHFEGGQGPTENVRTPTLFPYNDYKKPTKRRRPNRVLEFPAQTHLPNIPEVVEVGTGTELFRDDEIPVAGDVILTSESNSRISRCHLEINYLIWIIPMLYL